MGYGYFSTVPNSSTGWRYRSGQERGTVPQPLQNLGVAGSLKASLCLRSKEGAVLRDGAALSISSPMSFKASLLWEHSDSPCLMIDTSRSRQVTSDPAEIKSISHQTQLQPLHHLRLVASDRDPGCAHSGNEGMRLRSRSRLHPSSTAGKIPSVGGFPVSSAVTRTDQASLVVKLVSYRCNLT